MTRFVLYAVGAAVLLADQATKLAILRLMPAGASQPLIGPYVSITIRCNTGAAFGLFPSATTLLTVLATAVIVLIAVWGPRLVCSKRLLAVALGMLLGGAAGNLADRVRVGYVIDFIDVHFWPVFNIADIAITCGAMLAAVALLARTCTGDRQPASAQSPQLADSDDNKGNH